MKRPQHKERAEMQPTIENLDFVPWLKRRKGRVTAIFAATPLVISVVLPILKWLKPSFLPIENRSFWLNIIQLFFISMCFFYLYLIKNPVSIREPTKEEESELIADEASYQFWRTWRMVWAIWLLLYIGLVIQSAYNAEALITRAATHALNNLSSVALILCYAVLARVTVNSKEGGTAQEATRKNNYRPKLQKTEELLAILWLALALIEIMVVEIPRSLELRSVWLSWFGLFSGCIGAVSMALLIGRLDSMLLGVPILLIAALFLYSSIQPGFDEFVVMGKGNQSVSAGIEQLREFIRTVLLLYALIGKVLFFIVIEWLDSSGRLLFYMVKARQRFTVIPSERDTYVETKLIKRDNIEHSH